MSEIMGDSDQVDPIRIHDYLRIGGYAGLARVLDDQDPVKLIEAVKNECRATSAWAECCALNKAIPGVRPITAS